MPAIAFAAPVIRAAIATLQAKLGDQIAIFNGEHANVVNLVQPTEYHFGAADPLVLGAGPVVEVAVTQGRSAKAALDYADFDHRPAVSVVVWHEGERGELGPTYEMSLGLARCIIEVLTRPVAFGETVELLDEEGSIDWRAEVLPEDLTADGRDFTKWRVPVLITFRVETVERFG